ncbi:MAG: hypothetical protein ACI93L_003205 [Cyclobacteriaceae bacterium]|jgi:hypothetical protein
MKLTLCYLLVLFTISSCKRSVRIEDSVISLKEFRAIGELITAEYYGEVVSGLSQIYRDSVSLHLEEDYKSVQEKIIVAAHTIDLIFKDESTKLASEITRLENQISVDRSITNQEQRELSKAKRKLRRLTKRKQRKLAIELKHSSGINKNSTFKAIASATGQNKNELIQTIQNKSIEEIEALPSFAKYKKEQIPKKKRKQELVYLGRGAVKAGYDLTEIGVDNIFFSQNADTIYIVDVDPKLLNLDINPWFYLPDADTDSVQNLNGEKRDRSLFGFQVLMGNKTKNITLQEISRVKTDCKHLLRKEALDRNIYEKARVNAEDALEGLFSLMSINAGNQVNRVIISHSKYFFDKAEYLYDLKIDIEEFEAITELVADDLVALDSVYYGYQSLLYQQQLLDKFIIDLYIESIGHQNCSGWEQWVVGYFDEREIDIAKFIIT